MASHTGSQGDTQHGTGIDTQGGRAGKWVAYHLLNQQARQAHGGTTQQSKAEAGQFVQANQQFLWGIQIQWKLYGQPKGDSAE